MSDDTRDAHTKLRIVPIYDIERAVATYLTEKLGEMALAEPYKDITLVFRSLGGQVLEGLACIDSINMARGMLKGDAKIRGLVQGYAFSMATFVLQFCDYRAITEHSQLMVHGWQAGMGGDKKAFDAEVLHTKLNHEVMARAYAARTKKSFAWWNKLLGDSTPMYLTAAKALELGLVDEVVPVRIPGSCSIEEAA